MTERLPRLTKVIYGTGDWGVAAFNTLRQIFYAIFLTDVVGLDPRLASFAALIGVLWDAINDPLVGVLSDKLRTRWGRRRPFLLMFAVPYGLAYLILWWAPLWDNQIVLMLHFRYTAGARMARLSDATAAGHPLYAAPGRCAGYSGPDRPRCDIALGLLADRDLTLSVDQTTL